MAVLTMLSSLPANFSLIRVVSFSTSRWKILAIKPRTKMFLPLSLAVPPSASTVRPVIGHADVDETFVVEVRLDVIGIVKEHAAFFQKADVVLVTVLIKRDEEVGFVAGGKHFAGAHADLENGGPAGDGGRDRHVGHDVLSLRPASRARKAPALWMPSCELPASRMTASLMFSGRKSARSVPSRTGRSGRGRGRRSCCFRLPETGCC